MCVCVLYTLWAHVFYSQSSFALQKRWNSSSRPWGHAFKDFHGDVVSHMHMGGKNSPHTHINTHTPCLSLSSCCRQSLGSFSTELFHSMALLRRQFTHSFPLKRLPRLLDRRLLLSRCNTGGTSLSGLRQHMAATRTKLLSTCRNSSVRGFFPGSLASSHRPFQKHEHLPYLHL